MAVKDKPILVTGSHRSGTTWTGRVLSSAPKVGYVHEPFNILPGLSWNPRPFAHWYHCMGVSESAEYEEVFGNILRFRYPVLPNLKANAGIRNALRLGRRQFHALRYRSGGFRPLIKDPIAFFSAEWFGEKFDAEVLVLVRHPAAFCSSLKIKGWSFDFDHFAAQPELVERYLSSFADDIRRQANSETSLIEQAALLWRCIHRTVLQYMDAHPDWLFVKHEDLSIEPLIHFGNIFEQFDLEFTAHARSFIQETSGLHNPVEQSPDSKFVRNSRANVTNWKARLSSSEIEYVRRETADVSEQFYGPADW